MFGKAIPLFTIFGFSVKLDPSWAIILVLVIWSLASGVFPNEVEGLSHGAYILMGLAAALGLFASIIFHELCHSLVARRFGLPMNGITLFLFGGVAEMSDEPPSPKSEFMMAIAGPVSSLVLAAVLLAVSWALAGGGAEATVIAVVSWVGIINIILAIFNMVPGFPLDGGRVLRSILWHFKRDLRKATQTASQVGVAFGTTLIVLGFFSLLGGNALGGLWWILIGMFLRAAAKQGLRQVIIRQLLRGEPVRRFMNEAPITVPRGVSLESFVDDYVYRYHYKMFPVLDGGRLVGCVTTRDIREVDRGRWATTSVGEAASPECSGNSISPNEDAMKALTDMTATHTSRMMVVDEGRLVGILTLKDLMKFLALKLELESGTSGPAAAGPRAPGYGRIDQTL